MRQKQTTTIVLALLCIAAFGWQVIGGDLNPSSPPQPTMKTLDEVEPRIPIDQDDIPYEISKSGSYYLTENVTTDETAIEITASDVALDLCGFTIKQVDSDRHHGILMTSRRNVEIRHGTISDFAFGMRDIGCEGHGIRVIGVRSLSHI